jgi:protein gp37
MGIKTGIAWTDATWNPWRGCKKISPGCAHCYMFREQERYGHDPNRIVRSQTTFQDPLKWPAPRKIFVCSWSDFFLREADPYRAEAWDIIRRCPQHTFQLCTKRPERIRECLPSDWGDGYPNVWLGVTAENQVTADQRIPILTQVPARVHWVSVEPMLEWFDVGRGLTPDDDIWDELNAEEDDGEPEEFVEECEAECDWINFGDDLVTNPEWREWQRSRLDTARFRMFVREIGWVVIGGESGDLIHPARLFNPDWARWTIREFKDTATKVFIKQMGSNPVGLTLKDRHGADMAEWPEDLRVREFPKT